jgi:hypothetical protein
LGLLFRLKLPIFIGFHHEKKLEIRIRSSNTGISHRLRWRRRRWRKHWSRRIKQYIQHSIGLPAIGKHGIFTGTCTGTFSITAAPATTATTFEGTSALSGAEVGSFSWTGCTPASGAATTVRYFDSNYVPRGFSQTGDYGVYLTAPFVPSTARVNDVVVVGTITKYTNSAKTTPNGREDITLSMEADTATTAIANMISKTYNATGTLTLTEQDRYRVAADGSLTPLSIDIQYSNGSTTHLVGN